MAPVAAAPASTPRRVGPADRFCVIGEPPLTEGYVGARSAHTKSSWPGLSRPSRQWRHRVVPIEIAGSSPPMTCVTTSSEHTLPRRRLHEFGELCGRQRLAQELE